MNEVPYRVGLNPDFWKRATSKEHLKELILNYMNKSYPHYRVIRVEKGFAICERRESL